MRKRTDSDGFTLIEMMVAMAVLSILMIGMSQFYAQFVTAARQSRAYSSIDENLTLVMGKMTESLKSAARVSRAPGENPFDLVGVDGDGKFVSSGDTPHQTLSAVSMPNDHSDRIHFHGLDPMRLRDLDHLSDRVYYAFWINGEGSDVTMPKLENTWGIVMRKSYDNGKNNLVPHYPKKTSDPSPELDLNSSSISFGGPHEHQNFVMGRNIDYLSFQYYDEKSETWTNSWDTLGPDEGRFPTAVRVAIRGYDYRADNAGVNSRRTVPPRWHQTTVTLSGSK